jgi:Iron-containing redox enzyme
MMHLSHSEILRRKIRLAESRLDAAAYSFWTHPKLALMFSEFLFVLYSSMRSTVPLMETASRRAQAMASADPVAARTANYLSKHAEEELHHDEWLLQDMLALGMEASAILSRIPPSSVAALVGSQYYWIHHAHPVALFGYLVVLEGKPPSLPQLNVIQSKYGLPRVAFRTLIEHAQTDLEHHDGLNRALDQMPLKGEHSALIALSAFQTIDKLSCVFDELLERHDNIEGAQGTSQHCRGVLPGKACS